MTIFGRLTIWSSTKLVYPINDDILLKGNNQTNKCDLINEYAMNIDQSFCDYAHLKKDADFRFCFHLQKTNDFIFET